MSKKWSSIEAPKHCPMDTLVWETQSSYSPRSSCNKRKRLLFMIEWNPSMWTENPYSRINVDPLENPYSGTFQCGLHAKAFTMEPSKWTSWTVEPSKWTSWNRNPQQWNPQCGLFDILLLAILNQDWSHSVNYLWITLSTPWINNMRTLSLFRSEAPSPLNECCLPDVHTLLLCFFVASVSDMKNIPSTWWDTWR